MIKGGLKIKGIEEYGSKINCSLSIKYVLSKGYLPHTFSFKITADMFLMASVIVSHRHLILMVCFVFSYLR